MNKQMLIERNTKAIADRQPGDIIFFHPKGFNPFGYLILLITGQFYHHGAIVLDKNSIIESDPGQGVHITEAAELETYLGQYILDLFRLKEPNSNIVSDALFYEGWKYDYGNVLWAGFGILWYRLTGMSVFRKLKNPADESYAVESEEYLDVVFKKAGVNLRSDIPATNVTAQNLADSYLLYKVSSI